MALMPGASDAAHTTRRHLIEEVVFADGVTREILCTCGAVVVGQEAYTAHLYEVGAKVKPATVRYRGGRRKGTKNKTS